MRQDMPLYQAAHTNMHIPKHTYMFMAVDFATPEHGIE